MINTNSIYENMFNSAAREFVGRVELLEGSTLLQIFEHNGALIDFTVERIGDNTRFFGYGVCQQLTVKLRDKDRAINIQKGQRLQAAYGIGKDYVYSCPVYIIDEVIRDENTNDLTIKAYDPIYQANNHKAKELALTKGSSSLRGYAYSCGSLLGMPVNFINIPDALLDVSYVKIQVNLDGEETIREVLDDLAEMFGAIYYFCNDWQLTFKRLDVTGEPVAAINKSKYYELSVKTAFTLANLASITELNDNISVASGIPGETQYLRANAFLTSRDDANTLLTRILNAVQGLTLQQYECKHRGDFRLEIGDKISFETKDGGIVQSYILDDKLTYHGGLEGHTALEHTPNEVETETNPTTVGDALKQTYARVDKATQTITLMANDMGERIASLELTTDQIQATVNDNKQELESQITQTAESINSRVTDEIQSLESQITQNAGSITSSVTDEINKVKSEIKQTTDSISLKVESQEELVAQLVLDVDGITAKGYVTFADLSSSGATIINGDNITTGTISADRINLTGSISWGDLTTSCKNTIASYAGDSDIPDYIHNTYISATEIRSPTIYGATIYAGLRDEGYCKMTASGLNVVSDTGGNVCGIGWEPGYYNLPYVVLGSGVDDIGTDQGLIKKYTHGIWIGDSDSAGDSNQQRPTSGTGIFIDFQENKVYKYINGTATQL